MNKAYDSDALRELMLASKGMKACITAAAPATYDKELYKKRHGVENFLEKIRRMRRISTPYDKTDVSFMAFVFLGICSLFLTNQF